MKFKSPLDLLCVSLAVVFWPLVGAAQSSVTTTTLSNCQTQIVTLVATGSTSPSLATYNLNSNQIVCVSGLVSSYSPNILFTFSNGVLITNKTTSTTDPALFFTGLSKVTLTTGYSLQTYSSSITLTVLTPSSANVISNYVPANAIVIPSSVAGNVQIILESSPDLVNWTAADPGTYGASAGTNRFFRVRAAVNP